MESSRPHVYSEREIYQELEHMGLEPLDIPDAYLFLLERPDNVRALFGCPLSVRKTMLSKMMGLDEWRSLVNCTCFVCYVINNMWWQFRCTNSRTCSSFCADYMWWWCTFMLNDKREKQSFTNWATCLMIFCYVGI